MSAIGPVIVAAAHAGPYKTLRPVAYELGIAHWMLDGTAASAALTDKVSFTRPHDLLRKHKHWGGWLKNIRPSAVLRGTSELPDKTNPEAQLAKAAAKLGIPVYALEDFPGNYGGPNETLAGLFVEFESLKAHHAARGLDAAKIHALGNPRYASQGRRYDRAGARKQYRLEHGPAVLWAGQPDGEFCRRTLAVIVPALRALGATLLFKAHPRDESWGGGGYTADLAGLPVVDLTESRDAGAAIAAADLVVTQFSSVAVEAGALGVPALFTLLPGAGADYLAARAGLTSLPWCELGAAFLLEKPEAAAETLERALRDRDARRSALEKMKAHFDRCRGSAARIAAHVKKS